MHLPRAYQGYIRVAFLIESINVPLISQYRCRIQRDFHIQLLVQIDSCWQNPSSAIYRCMWSKDSETHLQIRFVPGRCELICIQTDLPSNWFWYKVWKSTKCWTNQSGPNKYDHCRFKYFVTPLPFQSRWNPFWKIGQNLYVWTIHLSSAPSFKPW